ncbi:hypothetical protein RMQ97_12400 [Maricaulis sp. D1M11]|uniref:hypothetical protein n=1 Tax=Maricaulis sp. D1M11 TaxID=3076117 RepID=UPI0039B46251
MTQMFVLAGISALFALALGGLARWLTFGGRDEKKTSNEPERRAPLPHLDFEAPGLRFTGPKHAQFVRSDDQGNFGEALTALIMASRGWIQLNGKPGKGPQGIDGIFLRAIEGGWQACLIETKTNHGKYKPKSMSREKLLDDLDQLYITAGEIALRDAYRALSEGLQSNSDAIRVELWRHSLISGQTRQESLDSEGYLTGPVRMADHAHLMAALRDSFALMDREQVYFRPDGATTTD